MRKLLATSLCAVTMALSGCTTHKPTKVPEPIVQPQPKRDPANYPLNQQVKYTGSRHGFTLEAQTQDGYKVFVQGDGSARLYDPSGKRNEIVLKTNNYKLDKIKNRNAECNVDLDYEKCSPEEVKEGNRLLQQAWSVTKFQKHLKYWQSTDAKGILGRWNNSNLK